MGVATLSAVVVGLAMAALPGEYDAARWSGKSSITQTAQLLAGDAPSPMTWYGQSAILRSCDDILRIDMTLQTRVAQERIRSNCVSAAKATLAKTATASLAYLVMARAEAAGAGDINESLIRAQTYGAGVGWLAQRRYSLAAPAYQTLDNPTKSGVQSDTRLLLSTRAGVPFVANQFFAHPELRPMITDIAENLPDQTRRRFLAALRQASRE